MHNTRSGRGLMRWRRFKNLFATCVMSLMALLVLAPLFAVLGDLVRRGAGALHWSFLVNLPTPPGEAGGGMANGIAGSFMMLLVASAIGVPLGIGCGVFLSEYGNNRYGTIIRFTADVLNGVPSIVIGMTVYGLVVITQRHFSLLAGGIALGIMMVPTVSRSTEEMLRMVPQSIREAAWGLGVPRWRTTVSVVLRTATSGIITGIMLAFARVAGETAPLLFTAFGNQFWNFKLNQPTAALPLQIYTYAISAFEDWNQQAWAGALILIVLIIGTIGVVRLVAARGTLRGAA
ncbi:MAG: phosphate ABC transporter permease PstA [Acidobacteria bacterium]|nr:phosphate ABC transporter permease PstA [Acidobacteriota bacterium]